MSTVKGRKSMNTNMRRPKAHDSWTKKNVYFDNENMRFVGVAVRKIVCPECLGAGAVPWCDKPRPDEYDECHECDGRGEWFEPQF
jgi:DnaJ-class molecular chaperone